MNLYQKVGMCLLAVISITACGSGSNTAGLTTAINNAAVAATPTPTPIPGTLVGGNTYSIPGGTETLTNVFPNYNTTLSNTFTFNETAVVSAGDKLIIELQGSQETYTGFPSSTQSLDDFQVHFNNATMYFTGSSMTGVYSFPAAATVTFSTDWLIGNNHGNHVIQMPYSGGVFIAHCLTTAGAAMSCP